MPEATKDLKEKVLKQIYGDKVIWIIVFMLSLISIALIYSSSSSLAYKEHTTNFSFLIKQLKFVALGWCALIVCYYIPLKWYRVFSSLFFWGSVVLLMLVPIIGDEINGAKRWINLGGITFQPTELAKITIVLYLAHILEVCKLDTFKEFFIKIIIPIGLTCLFIMYGSVSSALFIAMLSGTILLIAGVKFSYLLKAAGIASIILVVAFILQLAFGLFPRFDTATSRITKYFDKTEIDHEMTAEEKQKQLDKTYQADMAKVTISSVGIIGKGPGKSTQRYVLPHPYSDFIFAIIIEEYGLTGGFVVLLFYMWFFYRCILLVKNCTKVFTAITVAGLSLLILIQAALHILVNVGIFPVTGHTLPMISLGGTSLVILCCAFGIILSVSRTIDISAKKAQKEIENQQEQIAENNSEQEDVAEIRNNQQKSAAETYAEEQHGKKRTTAAKREDPEDMEYEIKDINGEFK